MDGQRILRLELAALLLAAATAFTQTTPRFSISGKVVDDSTSVVLQNVDVFIANTTLGCGTDQNGQFEIRNIPPGTYEIVASRLGYRVWSRRTALSESKKDLEIRLQSTPVQMGEVVVPAPDVSVWRKQLETFTHLFFSTTKNSQQCKILNPEVLDLTPHDTLFEATARGPLEIDNLALGYHIQLLLKTFTVGQRTNAQRQAKPSTTLGIETFRGGLLTLDGFPKYVELKPSTPEYAERWKENRLRAFKGSFRHFLVSLVKNELEREGFRIFLMPYEPVRKWDPHRVPVSEDDILSDGPKSHEFVLHVNGVLEVEYTREEVEPGYDLLKKKGTDWQVSWLRLNYDAVTVNSRGLIEEWFPTAITGYWAWKRMADALPLDYEPEHR
jgi:hypothetical protein